MRTRVAVAGVLASAALVAAAPAGATIHEIVGQWCSGQAELAPPGISDPANMKTFARPLVASGVVSFVPFMDGVLIEFNFDHPAVKILPAGDPVPFGPNTWITPWTTDDDFPAFRNCPGYVGGSLP